MTLEILIQIVLFGVALAMDAFAISITDGLIYKDINSKKSLFIALVFGLMQMLMPLIGYFIIDLIRVIVGTNGGETAINIFKVVVAWVSFASLDIIGGKMIYEGINELIKPLEEKKEKLFSIKEVLIMGVATSIDALAVGISLHAGLSTNVTIWLHGAIIFIITFIICIIGLFLGGKISKLFKGKNEITLIIGGSILVLLGVWIILSHYLGI